MSIKIKAKPGELVPGVHEWTRGSYDMCYATNFSRLKHWDENDADFCPAEAVHAEEFKAATKEMIFGTRLHSRVLTPDEFKIDYAVMPDFGYLRKHDASGTTAAEGKQNKAAKALWEEANKKKEWISAEDGKLIEDMRNSLMNHPVCGPLLELPGKREVSVVWQHPSGTWCKGLVDLAVEVPDLPAWRRLGFAPGLHLVDLKTTGRSVSRWSWANSAAKWKYHGQAAFYFDGWRESTGVEPVGFIFMPVCKEGKLSAAAYVMDARHIVWGQKFYERCMVSRKKWHDKGEYPGYTPKLTLMTMPEWAQEDEDFADY